MNKFAFEFGRALVKSNAAVPGAVAEAVPALQQFLSTLGHYGVAGAKHVGGVTGLLPSRHEAMMLRNAYRGMRGVARHAVRFANRDQVGKLELLRNEINKYHRLNNKITNDRLMRGFFTGSGVLAGDDILDRLRGQ